MRAALLTLLDMVKELNAKVQLLEAQVKQTSRNSSKPRSSDPPSAPPAPPRVPRGRPAGAQHGHADQQHQFLPPDQVDQTVELRPSRCPSCHTDLAADLPLVGPIWCSQVWELPPIVATITEYQQQSVCCPCCDQVLYGSQISCSQYKSLTSMVF